MTGTISDDNLTSVTVFNDTLDPIGQFEAQLRQMLFIARSVDVEEGDNDLYALAVDKSSNETRYPAEGGTYHTVTLADQPDPNLDYVFDDNGCLIEIIEDTTTLKEYSYDSENRLISVVDDPDGTPVTLARFQYDALGRRILVELYNDVGALESTTRYIYDGDRVIEEYLDDSGTWLFDTAYIHGLGIDNVLAITHDTNGTPSSYYYYHYDGIGSVTELTDSSGSLAQAYEYDAWGIATIYAPDETTIRNPYLFTGRRWDARLALYYYRARHYDPALGRFLQTDPAGYDAGINLYLYVGSTPTVFIDPTGMDPNPVAYDPRRDTYVYANGGPGSMQEMTGVLTQPGVPTSTGHIFRSRAITDRFVEPRVGAMSPETENSIELLGKDIATATVAAGEFIEKRVWRPMGFQTWRDNESKPSLSPFWEGFEQGAWQMGDKVLAFGALPVEGTWDSPEDVRSARQAAPFATIAAISLDSAGLAKGIAKGLGSRCPKWLDKPRVITSWGRGSKVVTWGDKVTDTTRNARRSRGASVSTVDESVERTLSEAHRPGSRQRFWTKKTTFKETRVYQRDDLFDIRHVDKQGRTNLQRMEQGYAPIGHDGKPIHLHHLTQDPACARAEVSQAFHQRYFKIIHENTGQLPSKIDRAASDAFRKGYWVHRWKEITQGLGALLHW